MAPTRIRARAARAANKDPRGRYAPPEGDHESAPPQTSTADSLPSILKTGTTASNPRYPADDNASWRLNKRDKRTIKHNSLLAKVRDGGIQKPTGKTRRPAKKLKADIGDLADALPEVDDDEEFLNSDEDGWEGVSGEEDGDVSMAQPGTATKKRRRRKPAATSAQGKMVMTSLKHRPGAMKKKMAMEGREMERFQKNLAVMVGGGGGPQTATTSRPATASAASAPQQADRWAALRGFISNTMVQNRAFAGA